MRGRKIKILSFILSALVMIGFSFLYAEQKEVKGFQGIPVYPGADYPEKHPEEPGKDYSGVTEDGYNYIWYVFGKKLQNEWDADAVTVSEKIISFYKGEFKKRGFQYLGEGTDRHYWIKGKDGIAISIPADYEIEYMQMGSEDAKANVITLGDSDFLKIYVDCAKAAQKLFEKYGIKTLGDFSNKAMEMAVKDPEEFEKFENKLRSDIRKTIKDLLKSSKISVERFKELSSGKEELIQKYMSENPGEYIQNQLGFSVGMDYL
jgi:hypothetical protein